jgi:membrane associated rhomboid family serine protease
VSARRRFESLRITQGALIVFGLELGLSLVYMLADNGTRSDLAHAVIASPSQIFEHARIWTLATTVFLQDKFITLLLHGVVMFMFVPTLERFWGTKRFYMFFAVTSLVGVAAGCGVGYLTGTDAPINGLDPFIYASIVAFGIVYARQPVQFFGVLPLTGRQLMYGFIGFLLLFVLLQRFWELGAAYGAAMIAAAVMTSKRWSPGLAWRRWQIRRARAKLSVIDGGSKPVGKAKKKPSEQKWLN